MTSLATQNPTFHSLNTNVPVGYTQIFTASDYAGTITLVTRVNLNYWSVVVRATKDAFRAPEAGTLTAECVGLGAKVWKRNPADTSGRTWVADYWNSAVTADPIEIGESYDLRAAIGLAIIDAARRGNAQGLW